MRDALAKDYFLDCLQGSDTGWRVFQARTQTLQKAITIAVEIETFSVSEQKKGANRKLVREIKITEKNTEESQSTLVAIHEDLISSLCELKAQLNPANTSN